MTPRSHTARLLVGLAVLALVALALQAPAAPLSAQEPVPTLPPGGTQLHLPLIQMWRLDVWPLAEIPAAEAEIVYASAYTRWRWGGSRTLHLTDREGSAAVDLLADLIPDVAESVQDPAWSPDGERLAFVLVHTVSGGLDDALYVRRIADGETQRLTPGPGHRYWPAWSPDGEEIVYVEDGEPTRLAVVDAAGEGLGDVRYIETGGAPVGAPAWSPDGEWIAWVGEDRGLLIARPDGADLQRVAEGAWGRPAWSPDGGAIAYQSEAAGRSSAIIDPQARRVLTLVGIDGHQLTWSPTGWWIAYARAGSIYAAHPDGTGEYRIATPPYEAGWIKGDSMPAWSPDGLWVAYVRRETRDVEVGPTPPEYRYIHVIRRDGAGDRRVSQSDVGWAEEPAWRPVRR